LSQTTEPQDDMLDQRRALEPDIQEPSLSGPKVIFEYLRHNLNCRSMMSAQTSFKYSIGVWSNFEHTNPDSI
jgi:hypothetical protein